MEARPNRINPTTRERSRDLRRRPTDSERKLWSALRRKSLVGARFRRQYPIGDFIVDLCCVEQKLVVEVDGGQHADTQGYDERRTSFLVAQGFRVLRFWNSDVLTNLDGVLQTILENLSPPS